MDRRLIATTAAFAALIAGCAETPQPPHAPELHIVREVYLSL